MSRHMVRGALVATWLIAVSQSLSLADENFWWRVDHFDTFSNQPVTNRFETEREALAYKQKWEKVENLSKGSPAYINWKITKERKPAKPDAGKAKDANNGGKKGGDLLARLREAKDAADKTQLSRAIEDYKQAVEDAYQRIKDFEKTLLGGTQEMQEKRFREINSLVDRYNRQIADFQSVMGPTAQLGYRALPKFDAPPPDVAAPNAGASQAAEASTLTGRWAYSEKRAGGQPIPGWDEDHGTLTLKADGTLTHQTSKTRRPTSAAPSIHYDPSVGTWSVRDGVLSMKIGSAPCLYEGRFDGQRWKGTYRCERSGASGVFELQRQ